MIGQLTDGALREFSNQANDRMAAYIEIQAMIAENKQRESLEQAMAYTEKDFLEVMKSYRLGTNENIIKSREFFG